MPSGPSTARRSSVEKKKSGAKDRKHADSREDAAAVRVGEQPSRCMRHRHRLKNPLRSRHKLSMIYETKKHRQVHTSAAEERQKREAIKFAYAQLHHTPKELWYGQKIVRRESWSAGLRRRNWGARVVGQGPGAHAASLGTGEAPR